MIVVDSSAVGPLIFMDEADEALPNLIEQLASGAVIVPAHWHMEVLSAIQNAMKRGRMNGAATIGTNVRAAR